MHAVAAVPARSMRSNEGVPAAMAARSRAAASAAVATWSSAAERCATALRASDVRGAPRIFLLERGGELEDSKEIVPRILRLADQETHFHQGEHDVTDVDRLADTPVIEHESGHHAEALQGELATGMRELRPRDVASLDETGLAMLQGSEHEQIRALVETRLAQLDLLHDSVAERQLGHCPAPSVLTGIAREVMPCGTHSSNAGRIRVPRCNRGPIMMQSQSGGHNGDRDPCRIPHE